MICLPLRGSSFSISERDPNPNPPFPNPFQPSYEEEARFPPPPPLTAFRPRRGSGLPTLFPRSKPWITPRPIKRNLEMEKGKKRKRRTKRMVSCAVCRSTDADPINPIVICDGCELMVHAGCYGNPLIQSIQDWFCLQCEKKKKKMTTKD